MSGTYQWKQIKSDVYQILESGLDAMYLICGSRRCVLIDTGVGTGDLKSQIEQITGTQVAVYLTHGHRDHCGGMTQFSRVYLSPFDAALARAVDVESRKEYVRKMIQAKAADEELLRASNIRDWQQNPAILPVADGDNIELGDRTLLCLAVPGHTAGSVMYYDEANHIIFAGDAANPIMVLRKNSDIDYKTYVSDWISSLKAVNERISDETCICAGHGIISRNVWYQLTALAERYAEGVLMPERRKVHFYEEDFLSDGNVSIMLG